MYRALSLLVVLVFVMVGCSSSSDERTLDDFVKAYQDAGIEVDPENKPIFQLIGAQDGVLFYVNDSKVAIYEYKSEKELEKTKKSIKLLERGVTSGKFLLETQNDEAIEIFDKVK